MASVFKDVGRSELIQTGAVRQTRRHPPQRAAVTPAALIHTGLS